MQRLIGLIRQLLTTEEPPSPTTPSTQELAPILIIPPARRSDQVATRPTLRVNNQDQLKFYRAIDLAG